MMMASKMSTTGQHANFSRNLATTKASTTMTKSSIQDNMVSVTITYLDSICAIRRIAFAGSAALGVPGYCGHAYQTRLHACWPAVSNASCFGAYSSNCRLSLKGQAFL
jgi:hypothetical protein